MWKGATLCTFRTGERNVFSALVRSMHPLHFLNATYFVLLVLIPMLSGPTVTTAWRVLGLRIEETASRYGG
jgi:hypothetical protein